LACIWGKLLRMLYWFDEEAYEADPMGLEWCDSIQYPHADFDL
jgi:hypothetical protein